MTSLAKLIKCRDLDWNERTALEDKLVASRRRMQMHGVLSRGVASARKPSAIKAWLNEEII